MPVAPTAPAVLEGSRGASRPSTGVLGSLMTNLMTAAHLVLSLWMEWIFSVSSFCFRWLVGWQPTGHAKIAYVSSSSYAL